MKKIVSTVALALGLAFSATPVVAAGSQPSAVGSGCASDSECFAKWVDVVNGLRETNNIQWAQINELNATIERQQETIAAKVQRILDQRITLHEQRRTIRHLRAEVRKARAAN